MSDILIYKVYYNGILFDDKLELTSESYISNIETNTCRISTTDKTIHINTNSNILKHMTNNIDPYIVVYYFTHPAHFQNIDTDWSYSKFVSFFIYVTNIGMEIPFPASTNTKFVACCKVFSKFLPSYMQQKINNIDAHVSKDAIIELGKNNPIVLSYITLLEDIKEDKSDGWFSTIIRNLNSVFKIYTSQNVIDGDMPSWFPDVLIDGCTYIGLSTLGKNANVVLQYSYNKINPITKLELKVIRIKSFLYYYELPYSAVLDDYIINGIYIVTLPLEETMLLVSTQPSINISTHLSSVLDAVRSARPPYLNRWETQPIVIMNLPPVEKPFTVQQLDVYTSDYITSIAEIGTIENGMFKKIFTTDKYVSMSSNALDIPDGTIGVEFNVFYEKDNCHIGLFTCFYSFNQSIVTVSHPVYQQNDTEDSEIESTYTIPDTTIDDTIICVNYKAFESMFNLYMCCANNYTNIDIIEAKLLRYSKDVKIREEFTNNTKLPGITLNTAYMPLMTVNMNPEYTTLLQRIVFTEVREWDLFKVDRADNRLIVFLKEWLNKYKNSVRTIAICTNDIEELHNISNNIRNRKLLINNDTMSEKYKKYNNYYSRLNKEFNFKAIGLDVIAFVRITRDQKLNPLKDKYFYIALTTNTYIDLKKQTDKNRFISTPYSIIYKHTVSNITRTVHIMHVNGFDEIFNNTLLMFPNNMKTYVFLEHDIYLMEQSITAVGLNIVYNELFNGVYHDVCVSTIIPSLLQFTLKLINNTSIIAQCVDNRDITLQYKISPE